MDHHYRDLTIILIILTLVSAAIVGVITPILVAAFSADTVNISSTNITAPVLPIYLDGLLHHFDMSGNFILGNLLRPTHRQVNSDEIIVIENGSERRYITTNTYRVNQDDLTPIYPTRHEQLILITCDLGSYNTSNGTYNDCFVAVALSSG